MAYSSNSPVSLGEARGLRTEKRDDYWMRRLADEEAQDQAQKKKEKDALFKEIDIDVDQGKYLPPWAKEVAKVRAAMYNDVAAITQGNPNAPVGAIKQAIVKYRQRLGELEMGNAAAVQYLNNDKILKDPAFDAKLVSTDSDFLKLSELNNEFLQVTPEGGFNFVGIPNETVNVRSMYDNTTDFEEVVLEKETRPSGLPGNAIITKEHRINPNAVDRVAGSLQQNKAFLGRAAWELRNEKPLAGETPEEFAMRKADMIREKTRQTALDNAPAGWRKEEMKPYSVDKPSAAEKKENTIPTITITEGDLFANRGDVKVQMKDGREVPVDEAVGSMSMIQLATKGKGVKRTPTKYDRIINHPDAAAVTIPVTKEMIDNNPEFKNLQTVKIKPTSTVRVNKDGELQLMSMGTVESYSLKEGSRPSDEEKIVLEKTFERVVPYAPVRGTIEESYPGMKKAYAELEVDETGRGGKKVAGGSKTGGSSKYDATTRAKIQRVADANGVSFEAAESALKANGKIK